MTTSVVFQPTLPSLPKALLAALGAGLVSAVLNNAYGAIFTALSGDSHPLIGPVSITLASVIPSLVAGVAYFGMQRWAGARAGLLYVIGVLAFTALSLGGPLSGQLPDGAQPPAFFAALTVPMHLIAGLVAAIALPRLARR